MAQTTLCSMNLKLMRDPDLPPRPGFPVLKDIPCQHRERLSRYSLDAVSLVAAEPQRSEDGLLRNVTTALDSMNT